MAIKLKFLKIIENIFRKIYIAKNGTLKKAKLPRYLYLVNGVKCLFLRECTHTILAIDPKNSEGGNNNAFLLRFKNNVKISRFCET